MEDVPQSWPGPAGTPFHSIFFFFFEVTRNVQIEPGGQAMSVASGEFGRIDSPCYFYR